MADPGAQPVVLFRRKNRDARSYLTAPSRKFGEQSLINMLSGQRRREPHRVLEQVGIGVIHAAMLLARHWMPGQKSLARILAKHACRPFHHCSLCASYIG